MTETGTTELPKRVRPLALPAPPGPAEARAYERLRATAGAADWLPAGVTAELDHLRAEHLRHLRQVNEAVAALEEVDTGLRDAEREHADALLDAHRRGERPPAGEAPDQAARNAARAPRVNNVHAAVVALAEHVERVIEMIRAYEDEWLDELRRRLPAAEQKRREAQRLVEEARLDEWRLDRVAHWIKQTADDQGFAPVPLEQVGEPPPTWRHNPHTFGRHWSELKPWNTRSGEDDAALRELQDGPPPQAPARPAPDRPVPSTMQPLSDAERFGGDAA